MCGQSKDAVNGVAIRRPGAIGVRSVKEAVNDVVIRRPGTIGARSVEESCE